MSENKENYIKRQIFTELKAHLNKPEISMIIGARQTGKTTLMLQLQDYLISKGKKTLFLNLDFEDDKRFFLNQSALLEKIRLELGEQKGFIFIDEIQRKEDAGLFLKGIYDKRLPYKLVVSGSGSLELKEKIHESLAGRKRLFEVEPVSFIEFANYRISYAYEDKLLEFAKLHQNRIDDLLIEYMLFGGYPRLVIETERSEKQKIIAEIFQSYLEKDITYLLKVAKPDDFSSLVKVLASQIGQLINYSELANTLGISQPTIKQYIWYLEKTFIIQRITPFFRNTRKEIIKAPVVYFHDLGLRNYILGLYGKLTEQNLGLVFQNLVWQIIQAKIRESEANLHFWRTKDKAEVDFVVETGQGLIPIEVKYRDFKKPELGKSFRNFLEKYKPTQAYIVTRNYQFKVKHNQSTVNFIPFYHLVGMRL